MITKDFRGGVFKLHEGDDARGMMGFVLKDANAQLNSGKMSCRVIIGSESIDRDRDEVVLKGMSLKDHERNPVVLLNHNREMPVGYAEDPLGAYTVKRHGETLIAVTYFSKSTELGEQAFRLVESKVLRGASCGFLPDVITKSRAGGRRFESSRLAEYSHVVLPSNQDCLVTAVEKGFGGKQLCDPLLNLLRPYIVNRPDMVTSGWENVPAPSRTQTVTKAAGVADMDPNKKPEDEFSPPESPAEGTDPTADPNTVEDPNAAPEEPGHEEIVNQSLEAAGQALITAWASGNLTGDEAMQKLKVFIDAKEKLSGAGSDEEIPNLDDTDTGDVEDDDDLEEKAFYNDGDAVAIQKAFALTGAIITSPQLQGCKRLQQNARLVHTALGNVDPVRKMVRKSLMEWYKPDEKLIEAVESQQRQITDLQTAVGSFTR